MSFLSMFDGSIGTITAIWIVATVLVTIAFILYLIVKSNRIIIDCDKVSTPVDEEKAAELPIGRIILSQINKTSSEYASDYLNLPSVSALYKFNLRLVQSIPSILTSIGILGTFFGLSYAVINFDSSSSEGIRESIKTLLSGMGIAFFTSIAGMACSLLFLLLEKVRVNEVGNAIDGLCSRLDADYHLSIGDELDNLFESRFAPAMSELSTKLENPAQTVVEGLLKEFQGISENFADLLTEKVNKRMEDLLEQFILATDSMKEIPGTIETATQNLVKSSEESINSQKGFTKETEDRVKQLTEDLTSSVNQQMDRIIEQFDSTSEAIKGIPVLLKDATGAMSTEIQNSINAQRSVAKEFGEQVSSLRSIEEVYSSAIEKISEANADLANTKSAVATLTDKINVAATSIKSASDGIAESNDKMLNDLTALFDLNKEITAQFKDYGNRIDGIEKGLKGVFAEIEKGLNNYASTSRSGMQTLLDTFTDSYTNASQGISNATNRLQETVGDIMAALNGTDKIAKSLLSSVEKLSQNNK